MESELLALDFYKQEQVARANFTNKVNETELLLTNKSIYETSYMLEQQNVANRINELEK